MREGWLQKSRPATRRLVDISNPLGPYSDLQWCCVRDNGCVVGQRRFEFLECLYSLRLQERRLKGAAQLRAKRDASILMDLIDNGMTAMNAVELSQGCRQWTLWRQQGGIVKVRAL